MIRTFLLNVVSVFMSLLVVSFGFAEGPSNPSKPGAIIDGFRFEFPCKEPMPENPKQGADGTSAIATGDPAKTDQFTVRKEFGGEKGKRYKVTLRFRGVVEPMMYKDGEQVGDYFYGSSGKFVG